MESPLDETCLIHTEPQHFLESYELYINEYNEMKTKAEDAKKRNLSILNFSSVANKDEVISLVGVYQSFQDLTGSIDALNNDLRKNIYENGKKIQMLMRAIKQALTELHSAKTEAWEINKKEFDSLVYKVEHFPKILARVNQELSRRNSYNFSIEQLMSILIKLQG